MNDATEDPAKLSQILNLMACPICRGKLQIDGGNILCQRCDRRYPVVGGIPVLLVDKDG